MYLNAGIMPQPQLDVSALLSGLFSRWLPSPSWTDGKGRVCFLASSCPSVLSLGAKGVSRGAKTPGQRGSPVVSSIYPCGDGCPSWLRGVLGLMVAMSKAISG